VLLVLTAACALGVCLDAGSATRPGPDERTSHAAGGLNIPAHVEASIVTVRSRVPVPSTAAVTRTWRGVALVADAGGAPQAPAPGLGTPLYALLRVFRL
jgi:hypothetical protein